MSMVSSQLLSTKIVSPHSSRAWRSSSSETCSHDESRETEQNIMIKMLTKIPFRKDLPPYSPYNQIFTFIYHNLYRKLLLLFMCKYRKSFQTNKILALLFFRLPKNIVRAKIPAGAMPSAICDTVNR